MQKHIKNSINNANNTLKNKKSEYSLENKMKIDEINRHQHEPHWEGNFTVSNLQPNYTEIQHDVSFSNESPK